jgi:caffeoyl-CoA O-methyltransferase
LTTRTFTLSDELYGYLLDVSLREPELLRELRTRTEALEDSRMQISPEQAQFMGLLTKIAGVTSAIEIGVFTGYSSLSIALALPDQGRLVACDIDEKATTIARQFWQRGGVEHKIDFRLGPAVETLDSLIAQGRAGDFQLAFIDADKENTPVYYEKLLELLRPGGLILVDNTLWSGRVADPDNQESDTQSIRAFNSALKNDSRIDLSLIPIGDGLTIARKR